MVVPRNDLRIAPMVVECHRQVPMLLEREPGKIGRTPTEIKDAVEPAIVPHADKASHMPVVWMHPGNIGQVGNQI